MRISKIVMAPGGMPVPLSSMISLHIPLVGQSVHAGFPSCADDFIEDMIDLNEVLIANPTATFLWRVIGDCMIDVKIFPGDVVIVDGSVTPCGERNSFDQGTKLDTHIGRKLLALIT